MAPQYSVGEAAFLVLNLGCIKVNLKFSFYDHTSLDCRKSMGCTLEIPTMDTSMTEEQMVSLSTQILRWETLLKEALDSKILGLKIS